MSQLVVAQSFKTKDSSDNNQLADLVDPFLDLADFIGKHKSYLIKKAYLLDLKSLCVNVIELSMQLSHQLLEIGLGRENIEEINIIYFRFKELKDNFINLITTQYDIFNLHKNPEEMDEQKIYLQKLNNIYFYFGTLKINEELNINPDKGSFLCSLTFYWRAKKNEVERHIEYVNEQIKIEENNNSLTFFEKLLGNPKTPQLEDKQPVFTIDYNQMRLTY